MWKMSLKCEETSLNIRQIFIKDVKSAKRNDREIWKWKKMNRNKKKKEEKEIKWMKGREKKSKDKI